MRDKRYITCCVNVGRAGVHALETMIAESREITRRTFLRHAHSGDLRELEAALGYARHPRQGLTMAADWYVSYHRSRWKGRPCVYLVHSRIEYIFAAPWRVET